MGSGLGSCLYSFVCNKPYIKDCCCKYLFVNYSLKDRTHDFECHHIFVLTAAPVQSTPFAAPNLQILNSTAVRVGFQDTSGQPYQYYIIQYTIDGNPQYRDGMVVNANPQRTYTATQGGLQAGNTYRIRVVPYTATRTAGPPSLASPIFISNLGTRKSF